jgi:DNA polymerase-3 subunit delta'
MSDVQLYGQSQAKNLLTRSIAADRLAHAYLFRGPDGVGKQLFAKRLAAIINCEQSEGFVACGTCASCKKLEAGSHPDFILVEPQKGAIKIDQVRELIKSLSFAPYEAKTRVVVLEDIHTMRAEAANSLLKTLEEPPENNILILTADSAGSILQTIISRCQSIPFYALTTEETVAILLAQKDELDPETAHFLARLSEGSPGKALLFYQKDLVPLWEELIILLVDPESNSDKNSGEVLLMAERIAALKEDLPHFLGLIRLWLRDCLFALNGYEQGPESLKRRKEWNSQQYFAKLQAMDHAEKELARNCNRTLVCEVLLFQLTT